MTKMAKQKNKMWLPKKQPVIMEVVTTLFKPFGKEMNKCLFCANEILGKKSINCTRLKSRAKCKFLSIFVRN